MNNFIELHGLNKEIISININHICSYYNTGMGTTIDLVSGHSHIVTESRKEIQCAIIDATQYVKRY